MNRRKLEIINAMQPACDVAMSRPAVTTGVRTRVLNAATTEVTIYGAIGGGGWDDSSVSAAGFKQVLDAITTPNIDLHMNSGGGDVFDGVAIHTLLARHPALVTGEIDGIAASAASFIMMACDKVRIARNAMMMIHGGMTGTYGNAQTHERSAALLHKVSDNIADMYSVRAGGTPEDWRALMDVNAEDGTWYTGQEAVEAGLADETTEEPDDPEVEDHVRTVLSHVGTGAPVYLARERVEPVQETPAGWTEGQVTAGGWRTYEREEPTLDPRDEQAEIMLAFLAERMKGQTA